MRIHNVEFLGLRSPLPRPASFSWGSAAARNVGLIRVVTEDGLTGVGETSVTFPLWSLEERALTVREGLRPLVVGRDVSDIGAIIIDLQRTLGRLGPLWSPVAIQATIGAFEVALWDLHAKAAGRPLYALLRDNGGAGDSDLSPGPIPLYAVGFTGEAEQIAEQARAALDAGFAAVKIRAGFGRDRDLSLLDAMAAAIPDMQRVLVDANMAWSRQEAREMIAAIGDYGVGWIEEPVVCTDIEGLAALRHDARVPIAAGENAYGREEGVRLVTGGAIDVFMPDIARCGGLTNARAVIAVARAHGLPYSPHQYASDVGFVTCLHLCAAEPGALHVLRDISPWPLRSEVLTQPVRVEGGTAWIPAGPGLGVELDAAAIERYRVI